MDVNDPFEDEKFHAFLRDLWTKAKTKPEARTFGWWLYKAAFPHRLIVHRKRWFRGKSEFSIVAAPCKKPPTNKEEYVLINSVTFGFSTWLFPYGAEEQDYTDAILNEVDWSKRDLRGKNLSHSVFRKADLSNANLRGVNLEGAIFSDTNLSGADLRDANLTDAQFTASNLSDAKFANSILKYVIFDDANLRGTTFEKVEFYSTSFYYAKRDESDSKIPGWTRNEDDGTLRLSCEGKL
jgi:hypothetical protein